MQETKIFDMIIVGGGPGGLTAAIYGTRAGLSVLVLEKLAVGGQMALTHQIDNYPGFETGIDGFSLGEKMKQQAERFGAKLQYADVKKMELTKMPKEIETSDGEVFKGKTIVIATGADHRNLEIAHETELTGRGVSYCAACDGMFYRGKTVVVAGGGNSAAADALLLSRVAEKVILVHRRDALRATKIYHESLMKTENIQFYWNSQVTEFLYDEKVTGVRLKNVLTKKETDVECDGVFISIGRVPVTKLIEGQLELDQAGYIKADETTKTSIPGVYAVGDVRTKMLRQIVTATADGAAAVHMAEEYLSSCV